MEAKTDQKLDLLARKAAVNACLNSDWMHVGYIPSTLVKQSICVKTHLKSSKKQLK